MGRTNLKWMFWIYERGMKLALTMAALRQAMREQRAADRGGRAYRHS